MKTDILTAVTAAPPKRKLVEWMCSDISELCNRAAELGYEQFRFCKPFIDVDNAIHYDSALYYLETCCDENIDFWIAIPCSAHCSWHELNLHKYGDPVTSRDRSLAKQINIEKVLIFQFIEIIR